MGPIYETNVNLANESELKNKIEICWNARLHKLPIHWRADYLISNRLGAGIGLAEIKCRNITSTQYPTFIISKDKIDAMIRIVQHLGFIPTPDNIPAKRAPIFRKKTYQGIPVLIFVRCKDKDLYYKYNAADYEKGMFEEKNGGRTKNTRDPKDIETVIHIPWGLFKEFPNAKKSKG